MHRTGCALLGALAFAACQSPAGQSASSTAAAQGPLTYESAVRWPKASQLDRRRAGELPAEQAAQLPRSPVPVLLPSLSGLTQPVLVVEPAYYAFSAQLPDGAWMSVHASAPVYVHDDLPPPRPDHPVRGTLGSAGENEGLWTVTFEEHGVSYAVEVGCSRVEDRRCQGAGFVTSLAEGLSFVGGAGTR